MSQNTNLNVSPYFDDFDEGKNYQRVLFKPDKPIQARELTTLQTILQNQIERFGNHFFKEGSMVIPGQIAYDPDYAYVQINSNHIGIPVSTYIENFVGKLIKGESSGVVAKVENYISNIESLNSTFTLYIKYISSSENNFTTSKFLDGENLISLETVDYSISSIAANSTFATTISNSSTGTGSAAKIAEGIFFIRGFFVKVLAQTVILDQYSNSPSYRVGLNINEEIAVASNNYDDLFDNAQGFSNFAAPGADRLVIKTELIKKDINDFNDENFIELLRLKDGVLESFVKTTNYNLIKDELARRTYDESGDYYVRPFNISVKECLNDRLGNNGVFNLGERTRQGNIASENLGCISVSPGKAYVRGFEIETNSVLLDFEKPRSTDKSIDESLQFNFGSQLSVNNTYGSLPLGLTGIEEVKLYDARNTVPGSPNGNLIGISKYYNYEARDSKYTGPQTEYIISLYDTQLFTKIKVNITFDALNTPVLVEGRFSGAKGFLYQSISDSNELLLYDVYGSFNINEPLRLNGNDSNRIVTFIEDYKISDTRQIYFAGTATYGTFTADLTLNNRIFISDIGSQFTITPTSASTGIVSTTNSNILVNLKVGDIVSYSKPGQTLPTFNTVSSVSGSTNSFNIASLQSISGINVGGISTTQLITSDLKKIQPTILNPSSNLYLPLKYKNSSNLDLSKTTVLIKKTFSINITSSSFEFILENNLSFESFDVENYTLTFNDSGTIVPLSEFENVFFSSDRKTITISNLNETGDATFTATCKILNTSSRNKVYERCQSIIINRSSQNSSGIGGQTLNDGLTYSEVYGTRVQDKEISLNYPDVLRVLSIYESSDTSDPKAPSLVLTTITSSLLNAVKGEKIIGSNSNSIGYFIGYLDSTKIEYSAANENKFIVGEKITFEESGITATVQETFIGDKDISKSYILDNGYRDQYLDFSRILRTDNSNSPSRKIRIIFNKYSIENSNSGDLVTINSYDSDRYGKDLPQINELYASDYLDLRPAVSPYFGGIYSPFESKSRVFTSSSGSSPHIFSKNSTVNITYDYYLPRIDKLFLYKDGKFIISSGVPSINSAVPQPLDNALEIATIKLPAYLRNIGEIEIDLNQHKRYTMKDISRLEDRIKNIEYYTLLSLLELETKNLVIRDQTTGLDRFKSGFFVDNFRSVDGGDIRDRNYRSSVDVRNGILRPMHYTTALDLIPYSNSSGNSEIRHSLNLGPNVRKSGDIVCLDYDDVQYLRNPFATRVENVNPFNVVNWVGSIEFNPSSDNWVETRRLGDRNIGTIEGDYLDAIRRLNVDTNTGLSPIEWGSWETIWTGVSITREVTRSRVGRRRATTTTTTTTTNRDQIRSGTRFQVSENFDTISLGDRVISTSAVTYIRSRNVEIIGRRLKPKTRFYAFFDDVDVTNYIVPKLIEVSMESGTFIAGETVTGTIGSRQIRFRLAKQNHKYGPVTVNDSNLPQNYEVDTYRFNVYSPGNLLSDTYSATSTVLNVDTESLEINGVSQFFGSIEVGMKLIGFNSKATATVSDLRLISDENGSFIGSFFIPDSTSQSAPVFETGTKTFVLTTDKSNSQVIGFSDSSGTGNFTASGILENIESNSLRIRNATVETLETTDSRRTTEVDVKQTITYTDPLAQSFVVSDENGICLTKCDIFFRSKDAENIPVTLQVRTVELGIPTQTILPFGEVVLNPDKIFTSENGTIPTSFYFQSPIYLEPGREYAIVLVSASNQYTVWISRIGEADVSTINLPESDRIIVSQQPLLGSLFKSQNGSTWDPSQFEDLKMTLYRAEFKSTEGSVRFINPDLNIGNNQVASLSNNPIFMYSRDNILGVGKSLSSGDLSILTPGSTITQDGNTSFRADLFSVAGSIGIGTTLTITNDGLGFSGITTTYSNINLTTITGFGKGATVDVSVISGIAKTITVKTGGSGYNYGDVLTIDTSQTSNLGRDLLISIPDVVGIGSFNSLIIKNSQGSPVVGGGDIIVNGTTTILNSSIVQNDIVNDGLHFKVTHNNHGMYSTNNKVTIVGIEPDVPPIKLTSNINTNSQTISVSESSVGILTTFEGLPVNGDNPGFILIKNEIIRYTSVSSNGTISGITRFNSSFFNSEDPLFGITYFPQNHNIGEDIFKYELNGISLLRINATHDFNDVDSSKYPISLSKYHIKLKLSGRGGDITIVKNRESNPLYFKETKSGGTYQNIQINNNSLTGPKSTQNILITSFRPNVQLLLPESTSVNSRVKTISGTSVGGNESSFVDLGFSGVSLNSNNFFDTPRLICSKINENEFLQNSFANKSFVLDISLNTTDTKVSPMVDLDRVNIITSMNIIDSPVEDYANDERVNSIIDDPHASVYVSKLVKLNRPADSLKVIFDAYRHPTNDIRVAYRLIRDNISPEQQIYELFPGFRNIDSNLNAIDPSKNDGSSDIFIPSSNTIDDYRNYEFTANNLPEFTGYQIKIMFSGTDQANVPLIRDLRAIATY